MVKTSLQKSSEKGFTLVELAIVMIIIGILIGGVLKGQELINNAQVQATVAQLKGIDAAVATFRDMYSGMPGDIRNPSDRIPNCSNSCNFTRADGNGRIGGEPGAAYSSIANENGAAWAQLSAADVITGVNPDAPTGTAPSPGDTIPEGEIGGGLQVGFSQRGNLVGLTSGGAGNARGGHYVLLDGSGDQQASPATASMTPNQAERIDAKLDDGRPNAGAIRAMGTAGNGDSDCANGTGTNDIYRGAADGVNCGLYVRIQG